MATRSGWVNDMTSSPRIEGRLEISKSRDGILIAGDPTGLHSLAKLVAWLADVNQETKEGIPIGERCHVHLYPRDKPSGFGDTLTHFSENTEICRLDAKGTGQFPERYDMPSGSRRIASKKPNRKKQ